MHVLSSAGFTFISLSVIFREYVIILLRVISKSTVKKGHHSYISKQFH